MKKNLGSVSFLLLAGCTAIVEPISGAGEPPPSSDTIIEEPTRDPPVDEPPPPSDPADDPPPSDPSDPPSDPDDPAPPPCAYPAETALNGVGSVMPKLVWDDARTGDGGSQRLDLEEIHCSGEYSAIVFILVAEWCPNCPSALSEVAQQNSAIEANGGLAVIVDLQRNDYSGPSNANADNYVSGYIGSAPILRVGDGDSDRPGTINDAAIWSAVPGGFVVRTSDMKVVANQEDSPYVLDWADIVSQQGGGSPGGGGTCEEESNEPNDVWSSAPTIQPGSFDGAVCDSASDFFKVNIAGDWRLDLDFVHAQGDLDVYVCNSSGEALMQNGELVGAESGDDDESFEHHGPATIRVYGWQGATNSYKLTLTSLGGGL
jgi:hypothetical protein